MKKNIFYITLAALVLTLIGITGCVDSDDNESVKLQLVPGRTLAETFNEQKSIVLRCVSIVEGGDNITVTTSPSKDVKAQILLFISTTANQLVESKTVVAVAPVTGDELDYDMTQAKYYTVTADSAAEAVEKFGIAYEDWQNGATNPSEKFSRLELRFSAV